MNQSSVSGEQHWIEVITKMLWGLKNTDRIVRLLFIVLATAMVGFLFGIDYGERNLEPQVETEYVVLPPEVIRVEVPVEVVKEVEVIREVPLKLREFDSLQEVEDWLADDDLNTRVVLKADAAGLINLKGACDYIALELQRRALEQGYLMSTEIVQRGDTLHMLNSVVVGNNIYYVEPQTDEVWLAAYRN